MKEHGSVRDLEQIQENDGGPQTPRGVAILLVALGAGAIVFAGLALGGKRGASSNAKADPLGELVIQQQKVGTTTTTSAKATDLSSHDVTFPGILSDESSPTTALAAVKGGPAAPKGSSGSNLVPVTPPI